jgi:hypothetical protein
MIDLLGPRIVRYVSWIVGLEMTNPNRLVVVYIIVPLDML